MSKPDDGLGTYRALGNVLALLGALVVVWLIDADPWVAVLMVAIGSVNCFISWAFAVGLLSERRPAGYWTTTYR